MLTTDLQDTGQSHTWNNTLLWGFYEGYAAEQCTAWMLSREAGKLCNPKAPSDPKWDQLTTLQTSQSAGAEHALQESSRQISALATDHPLCTRITQTHQSRAGWPQNSTWARSEDASGCAAPAVPAEGRARDRQCVGSNACSKGASNQSTLAVLQQSHLVLSHMVSQLSWLARQRCSTNIFLSKDYSWLWRGL